MKQELLKSEKSFEDFVSKLMAGEDLYKQPSRKPKSYPCIIVWTKDFGCPELLGDWYLEYTFIYLEDLQS